MLTGTVQPGFPGFPLGVVLELRSWQTADAAEGIMSAEGIMLGRFGQCPIIAGMLR